jgi:hypothetical protein
MRTATKATLLMWLGLALLASPLPSFGAAAQPEPLPPEAQAAVDQVFQAHLAERRHRFSQTELGLAVREVRMRLREVAILDPTSGGAEAVERLQAAIGKLRALVDEARADALRAGKSAERFDAIEERLERLEASAANVVQAGTGAAKGAEAKRILGDLEARYPESERLQGGPRDLPSFHTLTDVSAEQR